MIIKPRHVWFFIRLVADLIIWSVVLSIALAFFKTVWDFVYRSWKRARERISSANKDVGK